MPSLFSSSRINVQRQLYKRLILSTCVIVSLPIVLIGVIFYSLYSYRVMESIQIQNQNALSLSANRIERILHSIELQSLQLTNNPLVRDALASPNFNEQYIDHIEILNSLDVVQNSNNFIDMVSFYNHKSGLVLNTEYGYVLLPRFKYREDIISVLNSGIGTGWYPLPVSNKQGYIAYIHLFPIYAARNRFGMIMIQVSDKKIRNELGYTAGTPEKQASLLLMDDQGRILYPTAGAREIEQLMSPNRLYEHVLSQNNSTGFFTLADAKNKALVCSYIRTSTGRIYISVTLKAVVYEQLEWIKHFTLLILFSLFFISFLLILISSRHIYNPIDHLIQYCSKLRTEKAGPADSEKNEIDYIQDCLNSYKYETKSLQEYIDNVKPALRSRFLQMVLEGTLVNHSILYHDYILHELPVHSACIVMALNLIPSSQSPSLFTGDHSITLLTIRNIMEETMYERMRLKGYVIDDGQHGVAAILLFDTEMAHEGILESAGNYAKEVYESMLHYLKLQVTIGVGRICSNILDASVSYNEAMLALQLQIDQDRPVIYVEDVENCKYQTIPEYPLKVEEAMIQALSSKDMVRAARELSNFSKAVHQGGSYLFIYQSYQILFATLLHHFIKEGGDIFKLLETNLFRELHESRTSRGIQDWLKNVFFPLYQTCLEDRNEVSIHTAIETICSYVKENITRDLSLVQCAELVNMNPSYLSRIFKKVTGRSFLDYITEHKMEYVKKLLVETGRSINEIASLVGYSERNLYRNFYKITRMSPGSYRETHAQIADGRR